MNFQNVFVEFFVNKRLNILLDESKIKRNYSLLYEYTDLLKSSHFICNLTLKIAKNKDLFEYI